MLNAAAELPDDIDALKALVRATVDAYETQVHGLRQQLETRVLEIESLKLQIAKLRRMQFGAKSEKLDRQIGQLELRLEELQADEGEAAVDTPASRKEPSVRLCAGHCRNTCRARTMSTNSKARAARTVAAHCICWARMSRSSWNTCQVTGGCCGIAVPRRRVRAAR